MPTVFIANCAVALPQRFAAGDIINEVAAQVLCNIQLLRIKERLRRQFAKGDISIVELQSRANAYAEQDLVPYATLDDEDAENDPILCEALAIASDLIIRRMAAEGLPPPKGLDTHARALVDAMPELQEKARLRIEARYRAANAVIEEIL